MKIILTALLISFLIPTSKLISQQNYNDSVIFETIEETSAFYQWQYFWKQLWKDFSFNDFYLESEKDITPIPKRNISFKSLQANNELLLTFFSPNGMRAINPFSYYEVYIHDSIYVLGGDDYNAIELSDFAKDSSYYIFPLYNFGPTLNGIAWLSDSLFIIVGAVFKELYSKEYLPLIYIFNIDIQKVRTYKGKEFLLTEEIINKMNFFINEPKLIFSYGRKIKK